MGVVAPNGVGRDAFWQAVTSGVSGVRPITMFDPSPFPTRIAGQVENFDPLVYLAPRRARHMDRSTQMGVSAARMAVDDAGLKIDELDMDRSGIMFGTSRGQYDHLYVLAQQGEEIGGEKWNGMTPEAGLRAFPEACASQVSIELGLYGPCLTFASAGASSLDAIGHALRAVRYGELDVALAGGSQSPLSESMLNTFCMLQTMSQRNDDPSGASRPFDGERDGFVLGEGAGVIVVEEFEHAKKRGAPIYAEIVGYGATCDAYRLSAQRPDGQDALRAMKLALESASMSPAEIDYVSASGISTRTGDALETRLLKELLGARARRVPVSSIKSMIGHLIAAAGGVEIVATALALRHGILPPTINYHTPDPECDLDYVPNAAREVAVRTALLNSFGFAGKNAALVVRTVA
jgi:3-oxoacyl-[acyl-carrier-protein] synthase II